MKKKDRFCAVAAELGASPSEVNEEWETAFEVDIDGFRGRMFNSECGQAVCGCHTTTFEVAAENAPPNYRRNFHGRDAVGEIVSQGSIMLRAENATDRRAKELGIDHEVQTGDASFDDRVYIDSAALDDEVLDALDSPTTRATVIRILDAGFTKVVITPRRVSVEIGAAALEAPIVRTLFGDLAALALHAPARLSERKDRAFNILLRVSLGIAAFLWLLQLGSWWRGTVIDSGASLSVLAMLLFAQLGLGLIFLKGRSDSLRSVITLVIMLGVLGGFPALSLHDNLNMLLDGSAPVLRTYRVSNYDRGDAENDAWLTGKDVESGKSIRLVGAIADNSSLAVNSVIEVSHRRGRFGLAWTDGMRVVPPHD